MPLTLEIVTPEDRVYSDTIDTVVIPTIEGEIGILPGHIPLLTQVADGELRVTKGRETKGLVIGGGFAQVDADQVKILAEFAIHEAQIDETAVEKDSAYSSPTLVINGVEYNGARTPEGYKQAICNSFETAPAECSTVLSAVSTAVSGGCG